MGSTLDEETSQFSDDFYKELECRNHMFNSTGIFRGKLWKRRESHILLVSLKPLLAVLCIGTWATAH
jgi:hypothetical protein